MDAGRKLLPHQVPGWVPEESLFFVTQCAESRGQNTFCCPEVAEELFRSAAFRVKSGQWWIEILLLMPDHIHLLAAPVGEHSLERVVGDWKRWIAGHAKVRWQRGFFDHRLRPGEQADQKLEYIRQNPVRAGLVAEPELWPWARTARQLVSEAPPV